MKYFLVQFKAEYYTQGYEWATFQLLVKADDYQAAIYRIKHTKTERYDCGTAKDFINLTII